MTSGAGAIESAPTFRRRAMEPRREDVESIEGIVKALYEVVSGPAGNLRSE